MFYITDILFWVYLIAFLFFVFLVFYIPGNILLKRYHLSFFQKFVLGIIIGMILWGWQGIIFGYLGFRWLSYVYILSGFFYWLYINKNKLSVKHAFKMKLEKVDLIIVAIILLGTFIQLSAVWFTGFKTDQGLYICCGNTDDSLFHLALTNQLVKNFPPFQPGMYKVIVHNYHYLSNFIIAEMVRVFYLPLIPVQFQYSTILLSLLLGLTAIVFGQIFKLSKGYIAWLAFFLYFGGDAIYYLLLILGKSQIFSMSSLEDGARFLVNPPRAFSVVIFFAGLCFFGIWIKKINKSAGIIMAIIFGSVIGFKIYTGLFILIGLTVLALYFAIKKRFEMIIYVILTYIISLIIYLPVNKAAGGLYYTGFSLFNNFIVQEELGLIRLELARVIFEADKKWFKVLVFEALFAIMFIISTFGTKLLGLFQSRKSMSEFPVEIHLFFIPGILSSLFLGFFFQQTSGQANTFNFLVSVFIFSSIYTALACFYWTNKATRHLKLFLVLIVLSLTIPRVLNEFKINSLNIINNRGFIISNEELDAYSYLKAKTDYSSVILVDNRKLIRDKETPYISFFADRPTYLSGIGILRSHNIDVSYRLESAKFILTSGDLRSVKRLLYKEKIDYIIMSSEDMLPIETMLLTGKGLDIDNVRVVEEVFNNSTIKILKVI